MRNLLHIAFFLLTAQLAAQQAIPFATLDTNVIRIGEQTVLEVSISYRVDQGDLNIRFPLFMDTIIEQVEILQSSMIDTSIIDMEHDPNAWRRTQQLTITSFDAGFWAIPPFEFQVNGDTMQTEPLLLEVQTLEVDTAQAIKDIKEIYEVPYSFADWLKDNWQWVAGGAGVLALLALVLFLVMRKRPMETEPREDPSIPYYLRALMALDELEEQKLWQQGKVKLYYIELTEILRSYIERRYKVHALEFTTAQLISALGLTALPADKREQLKNLLEMADMVKFAKAIPVGTENEMAMKTARELIESTRDRSDELKKANEVE